MFSSQGVKYTTYDLHYNVRVPQGVGKGNENTLVKLKKTRTCYAYKTHVVLRLETLLFCRVTRGSSRSAPTSSVSCCDGADWPRLETSNGSPTQRMHHTRKVRPSKTQRQTRRGQCIEMHIGSIGSPQSGFRYCSMLQCLEKNRAGCY